MKLIFMLMTMVAATMASSEGVSSFIVGGVNATIAEHPYMAGIFNFGIHSCGGSILSASNVLTVKKIAIDA